MCFCIYAEIQDGCQKWRENDFGGKMPDTLRIKNFVEIALFCTIVKINVFLPFTQKYKMAPQKGKNSPADCRYPVHPKCPSCTVIEIHAFLRFTQKFKIGKMIFGKTGQYNVPISCGSKSLLKLLYLHRYRDTCIFADYTEIQDSRPGKRFFGERHQLTLQIPCG